MMEMERQQIQTLHKHILYLPANHDTDRPILAAISGTNRTLLMDAGNSAAHASLFLQELSAYDLPPIEQLALTHWHWDHIFGMTRLNLPAIAHVQTKKEMEKLLPWEWTDEALDQRVAEGTEISFCAEMIKKEFPGNLRQEISITLPSLLFEERLEVDLGGVTCILQHVGGDHAHDSTVVYVKEAKTLFLGDSLAPDIYIHPRRYTPEVFLELLAKVEKFDADTYVESHGKPMTKHQFQQEMNEMRLMAQAVIRHHGEKEAILEELAGAFVRAWTTDDDQLLQYFLNGV
jgi:glyoxylase-like metal-dependent hydrolase (beta-lactamase superfamily II)